MVIIAIIKNGTINMPKASGMIVMLVLMLIASLAYGIWSLLLKIKATSQVVIFKSFTPIFGALFSWLLLNEDIFNIQLLISLGLITLGTLLVNYVTKNSNQ
jgi:drug/metabolite transporter (DMT)-like permease